MATDKDPYKYFRVEAHELLEGLGRGVLELERTGADKELIARLLRLAHTLKGASRVVKLLDIARDAHALEDALQAHRDTQAPVAKPQVDALLRLIDSMTALVPALGETQAPTQAAGSAKAAEPTAARGTDEALASVRVELEEMDVLLQGVTEATVQINALAGEAETVERAKHLASVLAEQLGSRRTGGSDSPAALAARALAEELRSSLEHLGRNLADGIEHVGRELGQVRDAANRMRLSPAQVIFPALERATRDAAQLLDKQVMFETQGGGFRLDAHVLAAAREALLHMVRNAVAHGIESRAQRLASSKSPTGRVSVAVERRGKRVAFTCSDDGRGIDVQRLRTAAVLAGVLPSAQASATGAQELFRLLLKGGLTTSDALTEVSGRGVGLDIVRETAARLGGEVTLESTPGRGTRIELCLPPSLSSLPALVVDAGGIAAVVPLDAVRRTLRLHDSEIARAAESDSIVYEGKVIPFVALTKALRRPVTTARERNHWSAVVVEASGRFAALGVDRLLGTQTVVVRALPQHAIVDAVVSGAALDAEGNPQLVLDPAGLLEAARAGRGGSLPPSAAAKLPVLVIDDSLTTRMLEQSILESAGYQVELASSAEEGLAKAADKRYGLFLVDVEMPGMNGFEFVTTTRADPKLRETPAILVTSRGAPEDRLRGQQAGAHAYIVKGEFDQAKLLHIIGKLLG